MNRNRNQYEIDYEQKSFEKVIIALRANLEILLMGKNENK